MRDTQREDGNKGWQEGGENLDMRKIDTFDNIKLSWIKVALKILFLFLHYKSNKNILF